VVPVAQELEKTTNREQSGCVSRGCQHGKQMMEPVNGVDSWSLEEKVVLG